MPPNPKKTKGEILSELESIKDLLIEEDDIPLLQEVDHATSKPQVTSVPGGIQTSMFDELMDEVPITLTEPSKPQTQNRAIPKAIGENPFLPQHIRARLQGNNPPPFFDFNLPTPTTKLAGKIENRHDLVNELIKKILPQIEQELRLKLLAMTEEELRKL